MMRIFLPTQRSDVWPLMLGGLIALLLAPVVSSAMHWLTDLYDSRHPPVKTTLAFSSRPTPDTLRVRLMVTRLRDCDFARLIAMTGPDKHHMELATSVAREDGELPVNYPAGETVLSQPWLIRPVFGQRLLLIGHYECGDRVVRVKMIDEVVP